MKAMETRNLLYLKNKQTKKNKRKKTSNKNKQKQNKKGDLSVMAQLQKHQPTTSKFIFTEQGNGSTFLLNIRPITSDALFELFFP